MRDYELSFIVRPDIDDKQTKAVADRVQGLITQRGGELTNIAEWGKRRLAYHVGHHAEGTYYIYRLRMEPESAAEIEHELNLDEQVLRFIMLYLDPVALEALKNPPAPMAPRPERRPPAEAAPAEAAVAVAEAPAEAPTATEAEAAPAPEAEATAAAAETPAEASAAEAAPAAEEAPAAAAEPKEAAAPAEPATAAEETETSEA